MLHLQCKSLIICVVYKAIRLPIYNITNHNNSNLCKDVLLICLKFFSYTMWNYDSCGTRKVHCQIDLFPGGELGVPTEALNKKAIAIINRVRDKLTGKAITGIICRFKLITVRHCLQFTSVITGKMLMLIEYFMFHQLFSSER